MTCAGGLLMTWCRSPVRTPSWPSCRCRAPASAEDELHEHVETRHRRHTAVHMLIHSATRTTFLPSKVQKSCSPSTQYRNHATGAPAKNISFWILVGCFRCSVSRIRWTSAHCSVRIAMTGASASRSATTVYVIWYVRPISDICSISLFQMPNPERPPPTAPFSHKI